MSCGSVPGIKLEFERERQCLFCGIMDIIVFISNVTSHIEVSSHVRGGHPPFTDA